MKKYFLLVSLFSLVVLGPKFSYAAKPSDFGLKEGELISAIFSDDPDVYIVNDYGYKRLFLNPEIFKFYGQLGGFTNVKLVTPEIRDTFPTSTLFRNCESNDPKVYTVEVTGEDTGKLRWINTPGSQAAKDDPDFFKKVFCINKKEFDWYPKGNELESVKEVPSYSRAATPATPAIPAVPASPSHPLVSPTVTPRSASGSFTPTPTPPPTSVTQPAIPATPATPAQSIGLTSTPTPTPTVTTSSTPSPTASVSNSPTPTPTPTPTASSIAVTYPRSGVTWGNLNVSIYYTSLGITKFGFKIFKGSQAVYNYPSYFSLSVPLSYPIGYTANLTVDSNNSYRIQFPCANLCFFPVSGSDYRIRVFDWDHPEVFGDSDYFSYDTTSPIMSQVSASSITSDSAIITWTTDEPATGFVNYGSTANNWTVTPTNTSYATAHSFTLSGLAQGTLYNYRVYSVDALGNGPAGLPPQYTFTTASSSQGFIPNTNNFASILRNLTIGSIGNDVKQLQALLVGEVGYSADLITGYFGRVTRDAVIKLQEKYGITPALGYFGDKTRQRLQLKGF